MFTFSIVSTSFVLVGMLDRADLLSAAPPFPVFFFGVLFVMCSMTVSSMAVFSSCSTDIMALRIAAMIFCSLKPTMCPSRFTTVCIINDRRPAVSANRLQRYFIFQTIMQAYQEKMRFSNYFSNFAGDLCTFPKLCASSSSTRSAILSGQYHHRKWYSRIRISPQLHQTIPKVDSKTHFQYLFLVP